MNNDMYRDYSNVEFEYSYPISFEERNKEYLQTTYAPYMTWNYGDNVVLSFIMSTGTVPADAKVKLTVNNFRYEPVFEPTPTDWAQTVNFIINAETSKKVFKRGVYYCTLQITSENEGTVVTIKGADDCCLYVQ